RLLLRQDNADLRLTRLAYSIGLASEDRFQKLCKKEEDITSLLKDLKTQKVEPNMINEGLAEHHTATLKEKITVEKLLKRPNLGIFDIMDMDVNLKNILSKYPNPVLEQAEIQIKYESYIDKEQQMVTKMHNMENFKIPTDFDY